MDWRRGIVLAILVEKIGYEKDHLLMSPGAGPWGFRDGLCSPTAACFP
jgi:hypothetical protein